MKFLLIIVLGILLVSCTKRIETNCPEFPIPSESVQQKFDNLAIEDKEVWAWGNELLKLCKKLGTCEE